LTSVYGEAVLTIGPYRFTATDAQRTVLRGNDIFDSYGERRNAALIEHLRPPTATGDVESDLLAVWNAWTAAGPTLRAAGELPTSTTGLVTQLSVSRGGLPKLAVGSGDVSWGGMAGDRQATRLHHGRPWQALCLWSAEVIDAFAAEGHPLAPGSAGENITVRGLPWEEVRSGVRLRIGTVLCEVSCYALPCATNKPFFINGDFRVMHHERGPVSRVYATVLEPGVVTTGDDAILEP
jgi:MOSC domain-containing protein YiiM